MMKHGYLGLVPVIQLGHLLVDGDECEQLSRALRQLSEAGQRTVVIDLSRVDTYNSSGVGVLVSWHSHFAQRQGRLELMNVPDRLQHMFAITQLKLVFHIRPSSDEIEWVTPDSATK